MVDIIEKVSENND